MEDKQREIVNGANPSIIWTQCMDFLATYAKQMKSQYAKRMRENNPFTWTDLDVMNKEIHDKLDYLMTWDKNVNQNANVQQQSSITNESNRRQHKVRISESHLREIVAESVKKVLKEIGDTPQGQFAINAVRGRAAARPRYQNKQYGGMQAKAQQDAIVNQAGDAAYNARKEADPQYQNRDMDTYANAGYNYGFQKGMTN